MLKKTLQNVYRGWWMVLTCALISAYGAGSFHYGFSVFVHPIVMELGWDMALVSGAFSLYRLEAGVAAPLAGYLVDRMGAGKLISLGTVLMGIGYICLSQVKTVLPFYLACLTISIGFGFSTSQVVGTSLISKWFIKKRGKALGLYFSMPLSFFSAFSTAALLSSGPPWWRSFTVVKDSEPSGDLCRGSAWRAASQARCSSGIFTICGEVTAPASFSSAS